MNDSEVLNVVRESLSGIGLDAPLADTVRRGRALRTRRRVLSAAGVAGAAALVAVTAVTATGIGRPAGAPSSAVSGTSRTATGEPTGSGAVLDAWSVTVGPDDTVTVTIRQLYDPAGLQQALRADGVPARVEFQPGIPSDSPPLPRGCTAPAMSDEDNANLQGKILGMGLINPQTGIALTIRPRLIPAGIGIFLAANAAQGHGGFGWGLDLVVASPSCTGS
jgi:hypothetical protein